MSPKFEQNLNPEEIARKRIAAIKGGMKSGLGSMKSGISEGIDAVKGGIDTVKEGAKGAYEASKQMGAEILGKGKELVGAGKEMGSRAIETARGWLSEKFNKAKNKVVEAGVFTQKLGIKVIFSPDILAVMAGRAVAEKGKAAGKAGKEAYKHVSAEVKNSAKKTAEQIAAEWAEVKNNAHDILDTAERKVDIFRKKSSEKATKLALKIGNKVVRELAERAGRIEQRLSNKDETLDAKIDRLKAKQDDVKKRLQKARDAKEWYESAL